MSPLGCVMCLQKGLLPGVHLLKASPAGTLRTTWLVGKGRLSNHLNPCHSVHKLYLLKRLQLAVTLQGRDVFWKRANFSEEDEG